MSHAPLILKPHEPVAERVLLPGDPGRALRLAQQLIDGPRMLNHHRGLWGYSGPARDGELAHDPEHRAGRTERGGRRGRAGRAGRPPARARRHRGRTGARRGSERSSRPTPRSPPTARAARWARATASRPTPRSRPRSRGAVDARGLVASADIHDPVLAAAWTEAGALACDLATAAVLAAAPRGGAAAAPCSRSRAPAANGWPTTRSRRSRRALGAAGLAALCR